MKRIWMTMILAAMGVALLGCSQCGGTPYKRIASAQRNLDRVARFGETMDGAIKDFVVKEDKRCSALHKSKTAGYAACVLPSLKISWAWTGEKLGKKTGKGALQILQAGQRATREIINSVHDYVKANEKKCAAKDGSAPAKCKADWLAGIKPALCGAWAIAQMAVSAGAYKATQSTEYKFVSGLASVACGGAS